MTPRERQAWLMVAVLFVILAIIVGCIDSMGVLFTPLIKHFGWSRTRMSSVMSAVTLAIGLSTPVAGWLIDRIGARMVIATGAAIAGAGMLIGSQADSLFALAAACALFGAGGGAASLVSASYVIANRFGANRGIAMGVTMMGTSMGAALSAPLVSYVVGLAGWRWAFAMLGGALLVVAVPLAAIFLRGADAPTEARRADGTDLGETAGVEVGEALRMRSFWLYCAILATAGIAGSAVNLHLMPFLLTDGFQPAIAAWVLSTYFLGATVAKPILGAAADRLGVRGGICFALLMMGAGCVLMPRVTGHHIMFVLAAIYGFGIGGPVALMPLLGAEAFGLRRFGTLMGLAGLVQMGSGVIGPIATGAFFDRYGSYGPAFTLFGVILAAVSILPFACATLRAEPEKVATKALPAMGEAN
jgi:MFS family permease